VLPALSAERTFSKESIQPTQQCLQNTQKEIARARWCSIGGFVLSLQTVTKVVRHKYHIRSSVLLQTSLQTTNFFGALATGRYGIVAAATQTDRHIPSKVSTDVLSGRNFLELFSRGQKRNTRI
jgi:hypothetical protein